jgi:hypothetical protein
MHEQRREKVNNGNYTDITSGIVAQIGLAQPLVVKNDLCNSLEVMNKLSNDEE